MDDVDTSCENKSLVRSGWGSIPQPTVREAGRPTTTLSRQHRTSRPTIYKVQKSKLSLMDDNKMWFCMEQSYYHRVTDQMRTTCFNGMAFINRMTTFGCIFHDSAKNTHSAPHPSCLPRLATDETLPIDECITKTDDRSI